MRGKKCQVIRKIQTRKSRQQKKVVACTFDLRYQIKYQNTEKGIAEVENFISWDL